MALFVACVVSLECSAGKPAQSESEVPLMEAEFSALTALARNGDVDAQLALGTRYYTGVGAEFDHARAFTLFRRAAEAGSDIAQFVTASMLLNGDGIPPDEGELRKWLRAASAQGLAQGQYTLGLLTILADGNPREGVRLIQAAADAGSIKAAAFLGVLYFEGRHVRRDVDRSIENLTWAARLGHPGALRNLGGVLFATGDYVGAMKYFRDAAAGGDAEAQKAIGYMFDQGLGTLPDRAVAIEWFERAAEGNSADAMNILGAAHRTGDGVARSPKEALRWFRRAADLGHAGAQVRLARALALGEGADSDEEMALAWLRKAAAHGESWAVRSLERLVTGPSAIGAPDFWTGSEDATLLGINLEADTEVTLDVSRFLSWSARPAPAIADVPASQWLESLLLEPGERLRLMRLSPRVHVLSVETGVMHRLFGPLLEAMRVGHDAAAFCVSTAAIVDSLDVPGGPSDAIALADKRRLATYLVAAGLAHESDGTYSTESTGAMIVWTNDLRDPDVRSVAFRHEVHHALVAVDQAFQAAVQIWYHSLDPDLRDYWVPYLVSTARGAEKLDVSVAVYEGAAYLRDPLIVVDNIRVLRALHEIKRKAGWLTPEDAIREELLDELFERESEGALSPQLKREVMGLFLREAERLQVLEIPFVHRNLGEEWLPVMIRDSRSLFADLSPNTQLGPTEAGLGELMAIRIDAPVDRSKLANRLNQLLEEQESSLRVAGRTGEEGTNAEIVQLICDVFDVLASDPWPDPVVGGAQAEPLRRAIVDGLLAACVEKAEAVVAASAVE